MSKSDTIHIRVEPNIKKEVEKTLKALGMTTTEAINIYLYQIILNNGLPFEVKIPKPNEETIKAMKETLDINKTKKGFSNVSDLMKELNS